MIIKFLNGKTVWFETRQQKKQNRKKPPAHTNKHKSEFIPVYNGAPDPLHFRWPSAKHILLNSINKLKWNKEIAGIRSSLYKLVAIHGLVRSQWKKQKEREREKMQPAHFQRHLTSIIVLFHRALPIVEPTAKKCYVRIVCVLTRELRILWFSAAHRKLYISVH